MNEKLRKLATLLPGMAALIRERDEYFDQAKALSRNIGEFLPGHYHSPIPEIEEISARAEILFREPPRELPGLDMNEDQQVALLRQFPPYYKEQPFGAAKEATLRYYFDNSFYGRSDAIFLYCMMRHLKPGRIVEVGSGYSSCVMLDTNDIFFKGGIRITHIEPYPDRLLSLVFPQERERIGLIATPFQDVAPETFQELNAGDILFIDSTHVSKTGSDVNHLFFEVLPCLRPGVHVHLHDIFYPFEYPRSWVIDKKRAWNENYILRAFLQYNARFTISLMNTFLEHFHSEWFKVHMPLCLQSPGASIWLRVGEK